MWEEEEDVVVVVCVGVCVQMFTGMQRPERNARWLPLSFTALLL